MEEKPYFFLLIAVPCAPRGKLFAGYTFNAATNQAAGLLWQAVHFFEVGGATSVLVFTISS